MRDIKVGQRITVGSEVEFWSEDDHLDYRADRWAPFEVVGIEYMGDDYTTLDLICRDGIWEHEIQLDVDYDDIALAE